VSADCPPGFERPLGQAPSATIGETDLDLTLAPGENDQFTVVGTYELVSTEEGKKANLHFRVSGQGAMSSEPFHLGINVLIRGEGVVDDEDDQAGPPPWVPGPPPWVGLNGDDEDENAGATSINMQKRTDSKAGPPSFVFGLRKR